LLGQPNNQTTEYIPPPVNGSDPIPDQDPRTNEDCLFLDVFVPESVLNSAGNGSGAAVLVWIYGGGYTLGEKANKAFNPAGLIAASGNVSDGNIIYVAMNYRLGALGWSPGPTFQGEGGTSNLGLYDQRFALEWVQKYIHQFGGDPSQVTVLGESAGGGSIMHQITAYGGSQGPVPFQRAIAQSPGFDPVTPDSQQDATFKRFMDLANATSLAELRALPADQLIRANFWQVYASPYGQYTYGPVVDGSFVPAQAAALLGSGRFDKSVSVMVGHNSNEGIYFTEPSISTDADIETALLSLFPTISNSSLEYLTTVLYPSVFNGSYPYTSQTSRAALITSEVIFLCNTNYLDRAFSNKTYAYLFAVAPAFHGDDVAFTYYDGGAVSSVPTQITNATVAFALQDFITSFALEGKPVAEGVVEFPQYGPEANILVITDTEMGIFPWAPDDASNPRCLWWQEFLTTELK
jgi:carboxylesterase type B